MAWVTQELLDVWKSGEFVGENTPMAVVQVQLGHWVRGWYTQGESLALPGGGSVTVSFPEVNAAIWGEGGFGPDPHVGHWAAAWLPTTPWYDVPNLSSIKRTKDFAKDRVAITVCEIVLDAQDFVPKVGALGDAYHAIAPGWLAPARNYVAPNRPDPGWEESPWSPHGDPLPQGRITDSVKIRVWQGYGQPETDGDGHTPAISGGTNGAWTFAGMIDDVDLDGDPNLITLTARNGKLLTDQRVFRAAKSVQLKDPITFYDTEAATQHKLVGAGAHASSHQDGFPARNVLDFPDHMYNPTAAAYSTKWRSLNDISAGMEWLEIRLPEGRYRDIWIEALPGMLAYVSVYVRPMVHWTKDGRSGLNSDVRPATVDGIPLVFADGKLEGWVDQGIGSAPDGTPIVRTFTTESGPKNFAIYGNLLSAHEFELGRHSVIRLGFTSGTPGPAEVGDLHAIHRVVDRDIAEQQFILVSDASEVAKVALRWAGYSQWEVEDARVRLSDGTNYGPGVIAKSSGRLAFNRSHHLIDIISDLGKQLGYIFFIADPTDGNSEGVPTFRRDSSLLEAENTYLAATVNEDTMLTGLKVKDTDEDRPFIIRVRGKTASARQGGVPLGGDSISRIMAIYFPPWAYGSRSGGVLRHIVYQQDQLVTYAQCLYNCFLIAINAALEMHTAIAEIPANPIIEIDDQVSVIDEPTATNSRLWIVKLEDTMTLGQNASWKQTLEGSLLDTQDMAEVIAQVTGKQRFEIGSTGPIGLWIEAGQLNWSTISDPYTGELSGYVPPLIVRPRDAEINDYTLWNIYARTAKRIR